SALAVVQAQTGDIDSAIAAFPHFLEGPNGETRGRLPVKPLPDPLRKDPRFQKLIVEQHQQAAMTAQSPSGLKFEIGHVLFIDIVRFSTLLIDQQSEQLETLKRIVRGTEQFRAAEAKAELLRLPTGDGGALVFRNSPEAPVLCALEIAKALK